MAFRVHLAGDLNHKISFVAGSKSTTFYVCHRVISRLRSAFISFVVGFLSNTFSRNLLGLIR